MANGTTIGQVQLDLLLNSQNFQSQLNNAVRQSVQQAMAGRARSQVTQAFTKLGQIAAAAFSVKALVDFSKKAISLGADLTEVQNVVDVVFTNMSADVDKFAKASLRNFGLSETMAKQYIGTMGAMAKSFGFTEREAYTMGTTLTGLAGDVASFYNLSADEAYSKLRGVFTGETEGLKSIGVTMTQAALDQYALAKGYGKTTAKMSEQEKVALRYLFVQERLTDAQGDFIRSSNSWSNQMRLLTGQWQQFQTNIGQGLISALTPALQAINRLMERLVRLSALFKAVMQQLYGKQETGAGSAATAQAEAMQTLATNTGAVGNAAQKTAKKLKSLMGFDELNILPSQEDTEAVANSLGSLSGSGIDIGNGLYGDLESPEFNFNQEEIDEFARKLQLIKTLAIETGAILLGWKLGTGIASLMGLSPIKGGLLGALGLGSAALEVDGLVKMIKDKMTPENLFESLLGTGGLVTFGTLVGKHFGSAIIGGGIAALVTGLAGFGVSVWDALKNGLNWLNGVAIPAFASLGGAGAGALIGSLGGPIGTGIGALIGLVVGAVTDLGIYIYQNFDSVKAFVKKTLDAIGGFFSKAGSTISKAWSKAWEGISNTAKTVGKNISNFCSNIWDGLTESTNKVATTVKNKISSLFDSVKNTISTAKDWITNTFNNLYNSISNVFKSISDNVGNAFNSALSTVQNISGIISSSVSNAFNAMKDSVRNIFSSMSQSVSNAFSGIYNDIYGVLGGALSWVQSQFSSVYVFLSNMGTSISNVFSNMWNYVSNAFYNGITYIQNAWSSVHNWFSSTLSNFQNYFLNIFYGIRDGIQRIGNTLGNILKTPLNGMISLANSAISRLNRISVSVPNWVPVYGGRTFGFNLSSIPYLAQGGYLGPNNPRLAVVGDNRHEGEIVAPESKISEAVASQLSPVLMLMQQLINTIASQQGKDTGDITIPIYLDGNIMDSYVVRAGSRNAFRTGGIA